MKKLFITDELELFRESFSAFLEKEIRPHMDHWEAAGKVIRSIYKRLREQALLTSPNAFQSTLNLYYQKASYASEDNAVTALHDIYYNLLNSNDFWEGSRAFAEKRKSKWAIDNL